VATGGARRNGGWLGQVSFRTEECHYLGLKFMNNLGISSHNSRVDCSLEVASSVSDVFVRLGECFFHGLAISSKNLVSGFGSVW